MSDSPGTACAKSSRPSLRERLFRHPYALLILANLFWSGNFIVGRAVHGRVPPVGLAFWRWAVGSLILIRFAWPHLKRDWPAIRRAWGIVLLLSALGIAAFNTLVYVGLQSTAAVNGLMIQSAMPVVIVLMSYLLFRDAVSPRQALGVVISLTGALTIVLRGDPHALASASLNPGDLWILAAVVCYAAYSVLLRRRPALHPLSFLAATFVTGTVLLAPLYVYETLVGQAMPLDATTVLAVGYVAVFPSILAYLCFNRGVELIGANRAGLFFHLIPAFGSLLAVALLGERLHAFQAVGLALILTGIHFASRRPRFAASGADPQ